MSASKIIAKIAQLTKSNISINGKQVEIPIFQKMYINYAQDLQNRVISSSTIVKQRFLNTETKFNESSEKKSFVANEWMIRDQEISNEIKFEKEKHIKAKAAYMMEFVSYKNNVKSGREYLNDNMVEDEEIYQIVVDLEMQKKRLDQCHLELSNSLKRIEKLKGMRADLSLAQEFKSLKLDHLVVSGDHRLSRDNVSEINTLWKKSLKLDPNVLATQLENMSNWKKNFRVAKKFLHAMSLSLQLKKISSKQMI